MYLFLIILIPAVLAYYLVRADDKAEIAVVITGLLSSALFCALKAFFSFMHQPASSNFLVQFAYAFLGQIFIPCAVVFLIFIIVSKDDLQFRIASYFPLMCSFFAVYMPFHTIAGAESVYSFFELFLKPVMYLAMIASSDVCIRYAWHVFSAAVPSDRKTRTMWCLALFGSYAVPAVVEAAWSIGLPVWFWFLLLLAYMFLTVFGCMNARGDVAFADDVSVFLPDAGCRAQTVAFVKKHLVFKKR